MPPLRSLLARLFAFGEGRPLALLLLFGLLGLNLQSQTDQPPPVPAALFQAARQQWFDTCQRLWPRVPQSHPVTIVAIDEDSLKELGQWPWPRNHLAELVQAIAAQQPAAIGFDIYLPEADQTSPVRVAAHLPVDRPDLAAALRRLPDHDKLLAGALRAAPAVLGAAGFDFRTSATTAGLRIRPLTLAGGHDPLPHLRRYPWVLASLPELQAAAAGQAVLSVDIGDGVVRRVPLVVAVNEQVVPGLGLEMLRVATASPITVQVDRQGIASVSIAELTVPTQANGELWLHFARLADGAVRYVPAAAVLAGQVDADWLTGKLVMIGVTGLGLADQRVTPLGEQVPGIEIQAQVIESMLDGRLLLRPAWLPWAEMLLILLAGGVLIVRVPRGIAALPANVLPAPPRLSVWLTGAGLLLLASASALLFIQVGLLADVAAAAIILPAVLVSLFVSVLIAIEAHGRAIAQEQQQLREAAARAAGELSAAGRIQLGSLPVAEQLCHGETRFALATLLEPARDVGGDLYDFFMIDSHRLGFVVGDVSGKGLPASLFMAAAKTLARTLARHLKAGPDTIAVLTNDELAEANPEALFVTALIGVLDVDSGELVLVNAGHDAPWLMHGDGRLERLECPADAGGPPLCMIEGFPYGAQQARLVPGDTLVMITDGISEAMNAAGEIYGITRLEAVLMQAGNDEVDALVQRIRGDVGRHVAGAEPSDDLTLLVIRWMPQA